MNLSNLKPAKGATKARKRIGRGEGSGRGGTSTRGHKEQNPDRVILVNEDSKEGKCLCSVVCPNLDSDR